MSHGVDTRPPYSALYLLKSICLTWSKYLYLVIYPSSFLNLHLLTQLKKIQIGLISGEEQTAFRGDLRGPCETHGLDATVCHTSLSSNPHLLKL